MRRYMQQRLMATFGDPKRSGNGCDWWALDRGDRVPLEVGLDGPDRPHIAHVLIFDTYAQSPREVMREYSANTIEEAEHLFYEVIVPLMKP